MKVEVYCIVRNEERLLPYFLRHYATFCDWIIFFDGDSTDKTKQIIQSHSNTLWLPYPGTQGIVDDEFRDFAQQEYKMSRGCADWIIWVDCDEFIYHPQMREVLKRYLEEGVEVPLIDGYNMIAPKFPTTQGQIYDEIKTGYRSDPYCKPCVFQSTVDMYWRPGRHALEQGCEPKRSKTAEIKLLHYRYIDPEWVKFRNSNNWNRMDKAHQDRGHGWTCNPEYKGEHSYEWYMGVKDKEYANVI